MVYQHHFILWHPHTPLIALLGYPPASFQKHCQTQRRLQRCEAGFTMLLKDATLRAAMQDREYYLIEDIG